MTSNRTVTFVTGTSRDEAKRHPKSHLFRQAIARVSALSLIVLPCPIASAQNVLPQGGFVVGGTVTGSQTATALTINQSSPRAIINWNSFSVGPTNSVTFNQPNSSAAILNRVTGATPSNIAG